MEDHYSNDQNVPNRLTILYKRGNKLTFYIWDEFVYEFEFGVGTYILVIHPISVF